MTIHINTHDPAQTEPGQPATQLICHYCGRLQAIPAACPACGSTQIGRFGAGTQQVETAFNQEFAPRIALRMDQDTTIGRNAHAQILARFEQGEAQVLIGTQMIAKGHDFANVTVVGVLAADLMLGMSDFRSSERAFQLITQAAGRAGRGREPGTVVIQAYNIDDYAIRFAAAQDYPGFFRQEIAYRRLMQYPPFGSICVITVTSLQEQEAKESCERVAAACRARMADDEAFAAIQVMAPAKAPIYRIRNRYRRRLVIKGSDQGLLAAMIMPLIEHLNFGKAAIALDFDPYNML
jgi:primosomal protein N' (replication factor Y)